MKPTDAELLADARAAARELLGDLAADLTPAEVIRDLARDREALAAELREAKARLAESQIALVK